MFDRKAIMREAWLIARRIARNFGATPSSRLGLGLKGAWRNAKAAADPVGAGRELAAKLMRVLVTETGRDPFAMSRRRIALRQPTGVCPEMDASILHHRAADAAIKAEHARRQAEVNAASTP